MNKYANRWELILETDDSLFSKIFIKCQTRKEAEVILVKAIKFGNGWLDAYDYDDNGDDRIVWVNLSLFNTVSVGNPMKPVGAAEHDED